MTSKKINISIIVPIFNVEQYLERCINSIIKQTFQDFELILVDDGSTDKCGKICDEYADTDDRIHVIHQNNGGLSDARNTGLRVSKGDYVVFVDSDDWVSEFFLENLLRVQSITNADIVECSIIRTDSEDIKETGKIAAQYREYSTVDALQLLIKDNLFHQYVWNKLYRKSVIGDTFFEKGKTNEDEFWTYQIFSSANKIVWMNLPLYYYFQRDNSIMGSTYNLKRLDAIEAKLLRYIYIKERYPEIQEIAKQNLFGSCIYAGQMSMLHLSGLEKKLAKNKIEHILRQCDISINDCFAADGSNKIWFTMAHISFWSTCWIKNIFKKGF